LGEVKTSVVWVGSKNFGLDWVSKKLTQVKLWVKPVNLGSPTVT